MGLQAPVVTPHGELDGDLAHGGYGTARLVRYVVLYRVRIHVKVKAVTQLYRRMYEQLYVHVRSYDDTNICTC